MANPKLSDREWSAVSIALKDARGCGCAASTESTSFPSRIARVVFGQSRRSNRLADPRLEAVRRFACTTFQRRAPDLGMLSELVAHGFNQAQIDAIALLAV